jgi:hypothetical protein
MTDTPATEPATPVVASTPDSPAKKTILKAIRSGLQWILHVLLILPVAALKALSTFFTHLHDELSKA